MKKKNEVPEVHMTDYTYTAPQQVKRDPREIRFTNMSIRVRGNISLLTRTSSYRLTLDFVL